MSDELERLAELRRQGVLSDEEFAEAKSRVIRSELGAGPSERHRTPRVAPAFRTWATSAVKWIRSHGVRARLVALVLVGLLIGAVVVTGPSRAVARELTALCERLPSVATASVEPQISKAAKTAGMADSEYRDGLRDKCPQVLTVVERRVASAKSAKDLAERRRAQQKRVATSSAPVSKPKPQQPPQQPVYQAPQETWEQRRTRLATECMVRGSDYKWDGFATCVFDPY